MFWTIVIIFILFFIVMMFVVSQKESDVKADLKAKGFDISQLKKVGTYVGGHPSKDETVEYCHAYKKDDDIVFYKKVIGENPVKLFLIPNKSIISIDIDDSTSIENKVTLGRVLLVGIFALAWKKKKKNELAFISVVWNDGRFEHSTLFSFEGADAMTKANVARNELIRICN